MDAGGPGEGRERGMARVGVGRRGFGIENVEIVGLKKTA